MADDSYISGSTVIERPSIFDLLSKENLENGLKPAVNYVLKALRYSTVLKYLDELYLAFDLLLDGIYLSKYSASFYENFYGLKRTTSSGSYLNSSQCLRSLAVLAILPYLKSKIDKIYERLNQGNLQKSGSEQSALNKLCSVFVAAYPILQSSFELGALALQLGYLLSKTSVHSPWLLLAGVRLTNLKPGEFENAESHITNPQRMSLLYKLLRLLKASGGMLFRIIWKLVSFSLFFVQIVDYFYSNEKNWTSRLASVRPEPPQTNYNADQIAKCDPGTCPLCKKQRKNDTVLTVSGYVFCYSCISKSIHNNRRCPVTGLPANVTQMIRLFVHNDQIAQ